MIIRSCQAPGADAEGVFLFHRNRFVLPADHTFIYETGKGNDLIRIAFKVENGTLISLSNSPFGSFHLAPEVTEDQLSCFIQAILTEARGAGYDRIVIRSFPSCYAYRQWELTDRLLLKAGFTVTETGINQHLPLPGGPFTDIVNPSERRYLNRAASQGWTFGRLNPQDSLSAAYEIIKDSRVRKGYPVTMSLESLSGMFLRFPDDYQVYGVFDRKKLIAASVCIVINDGILYDFYHGDLEERIRDSPTVFLIAQLYQQAREKGYRLLDLGISTDRGNINRGLYTFKRNLGAQESEKKTYVTGLK